MHVSQGVFVVAAYGIGYYTKFDLLATVETLLGGVARFTAEDMVCSGGHDGITLVYRGAETREGCVL